MRNLKIDVRQENGVSPLNAKNNRGVTNDVMFAYMHEKINILLSLLSICNFLFLLFQLEYTRFCILIICYVSSGPP